MSLFISSQTKDGGVVMKTREKVCLLIYFFAIALSSTIWVPLTIAADSADLDEASAKAYLEKKVAADPGSCLVENMKLEIIGISDLVPGQQAEVFYNFEYLLRCNRGKDTKSGQGVLKAVRLRDGNWIDRDTVAIISK